MNQYREIMGTTRKKSPRTGCFNDPLGDAADAMGRISEPSEFSAIRVIRVLEDK